METDEAQQGSNTCLKYLVAMALHRSEQHLMKNSDLCQLVCFETVVAISWPILLN